MILFDKIVQLGPEDCIHWSTHFYLKEEQDQTLFKNLDAFFLLLTWLKHGSDWDKFGRDYGYRNGSSMEKLISTIFISRYGSM